MANRAIVALHAIITSAMALTVQRSRVGIHNASFPDTGPGVSVLFPGFGDPDRIHLMKKHVQWLRRQIEPFDCTIYVYKSEKDFPLDSADFDPCTITRHVGGQFMEHFNAFKPRKSLVLAWIDAVEIDPGTSLTRMIRVAEANELDHLGVGACPFAGSTTLTRNGDGVGREVYGIDFEFDLFHADAFRCLQSIIDVAINPIGWGVDMVFPWACKAKQGIWDEVAWSHALRGSYDRETAQSEWLKYSRKFEKMGWPFREKRQTFGKLVDPDKPEARINATGITIEGANPDVCNVSEAIRLHSM